LANIDFTGWTLDEARAALENDAQMRQYSVVVVETAPPLRPPRAATQNPKPVNAAGKSSRPSIQYGAWRVLRCRLSTASAEADVLELLVAREQLTDAAH